VNTIHSLAIGKFKEAHMAGFFSRKAKTEVADTRLDELAAKAERGTAVEAALDRSFAVIEFALDGTVLGANANFLAALGYTLDEIRGRHHSMFVEAKERETPAYRAFWEKLRRGEFDAGQYRRIAKDGADVWIQASYNPILDAAGKPVRVMKVATDITADKLRNAGFEGQIEAINKVQAVIEFTLDGTVVQANQNFLATLGYRMDEIAGRHHSMFLPAGEADTPAYRAFWEKLRRGEYEAGQFRRMGKGGKEVWIQASYNPILDASGKPVKVVKFATDITEQVMLARGMRSVAETVASAAAQVRSSSQLIASTAEETTRQAMVVSAAASQASGSVQAVAAAGEEMTSSIEEIARQVVESAAVSNSGVNEAEATSAAVRELEQTAHKIGDVVRLISDIASQTNLLALNATIEAARAGEAGKGFAVVASEVKALANQTGKATDEIAGQIASMQQATASAVAAIASIARTIVRTAEIANMISAAVEEQSATTQEIARSASQAATGTNEVAHNITGVNDAAQHTGRAATEMVEAADSLNQQADRMRADVAEYLKKLGVAA
jgi:methyl-accepting chemotaxis protein